MQTGDYDANPGDFVTVDTTSGSVMVTLPNAFANKAIVGVKMAHPHRVEHRHLRPQPRRHRRVQQGRQLDIAHSR